MVAGCWGVRVLNQPAPAAATVTPPPPPAAAPTATGIPPAPPHRGVEGVAGVPYRAQGHIGVEGDIGFRLGDLEGREGRTKLGQASVNTHNPEEEVSGYEVIRNSHPAPSPPPPLPGPLSSP